jgi:hypothetical protein
MPATDATGKDIHDGGEIDKLVREFHKGDVCHPYLMGPRDAQVLDEIGIATIAMLRVRRPHPWLGRLSL